jgi:putative peptide zinc metalloprotease protein
MNATGELERPAPGQNPESLSAPGHSPLPAFSASDAPRRRDDLILRPLSPDRAGTILHDPASGRYFRLRAVQSIALALMDGRRSLSEVHAGLIRAFPEAALSVDSVVAFARHAARLGWIEGRAAERRRRPITDRLLRIRIPFGSPDRALRLLDPVVRRLYRPLPLTLLILLLAAGAGWGLRRSALAGGPLGPVGLPGWALTWLAFSLLSAVHEFGHALTLRFFGGRSGPMGFMLLYGIPCFYCDLSGAWMLERRGQRMLVGIAGLAWQFAAGAAALAALPLVDPGSLPAQILRAAVALCGLSALLNLNPLLRLDGYWILCDWLERPNLRARSFAYLGGRLCGLLARKGPRRTAASATAGAGGARTEEWIFALYGVAAVAYTALLAFGLIRALAHWLISVGLWALHLYHASSGIAISGTSISSSVRLPWWP